MSDNRDVQREQTDRAADARGVPQRIWRQTTDLIDRLMSEDVRRPASRQQFIHWLVMDAARSAGLDLDVSPVPTVSPVSFV